MSRRDQIRMTERELHDFIVGSQTLILNSIGSDGVPHPMPMWFGVEEDGSIVMTTFRKSQKVTNLQRDPRVSLLAEDGTEYAELRGAVLYGTVELIDDTEKVIDILAAVATRSQRMDADVIAGMPLDADAMAGLRKVLARTAPKRIGIRLRPERVVSWDHRKLGGAY